MGIQASLFAALAFLHQQCSNLPGFSRHAVVIQAPHHPALFFFAQTHCFSVTPSLSKRHTPRARLSHQQCSNPLLLREQCALFKLCSLCSVSLLLPEEKARLEARKLNPSTRTRRCSKRQQRKQVAQ